MRLLLNRRYRKTFLTVLLINLDIHHYLPDADTNLSIFCYQSSLVEPLLQLLALKINHYLTDRVPIAAAFDDSVEAYFAFCSSSARRAHHASNCFILTGSGKSALICLWKSSYATSGCGSASKPFPILLVLFPRRLRLLLRRPVACCLRS